MTAVWELPLDTPALLALEASVPRLRAVRILTLKSN